MITCTHDANTEFAAHILRYYRFKNAMVLVANNPVPRVQCSGPPIITFCEGNFNKPSHNVMLEGRTWCEAAYDAAMAWQGAGLKHWIDYPGYIPVYPDRPDPIQYMGSDYKDLVQGEEIHQALGTGRKWTRYLKEYKYVCMETYIV